MVQLPGQTIRGIAREAIRTRISAVAVDLFAEYGFDNVTVEQVAAAADISTRSFHRYFPAKEDAVIGDPAPWGEFVRDALASRPDTEPVWDSLRAAYQALLSTTASGGQLQGRKVMRVLTSTPSLRARNLEKHLLWAQMLTPIVQSRLSGENTSLRARTIVQASLSCFDTALTTWAHVDTAVTAAELLQASFDTLHPTHDTL